MSRRRDRSRRRDGGQSDSRAVYIAGGALALGLVIAVIILAAVSRGGGGGSSATLGPLAIPTPRPAAVPVNGLVYGDATAAVTLTEYLDFQ